MTGTELEALADEWREGMLAAAEAFAASQPQHYRALLEQHMGSYRAETVGAWKQRMESLNRAAATAGGYRSWESECHRVRCTTRSDLRRSDSLRG